MKWRSASFYAAFVILLFALSMFIMSFSFEYYTKTGPGPGFFPLWVSGILSVLSIGYMIFGLRKEPIQWADILPKGKAIFNSLSIIVAALVFLLLLEFIGFLLACTAMLYIVLCRHYRHLIALGISFGISAVLFMTFEYLLEIPLPAGFFE